MPGNAPNVPDAVVEELAAIPASNQKLQVSDFDQFDGTANERSKVASFQPDLPIALREDADMRLVVVAGEEFTHSGGGSTDTFNLSQNIVNSPTATALVLYDDGDIVQPDTVDYAGDSFDYTDNEASTLHAFYVARDAGTVEIEKSAPRSQGNVTEVVFDEATPILAERNQHKQPLHFDFDGPLEGVVPARWTLDVYVDVPYAVRWDDSGLSTDNDDVAVNALLSIPIRRAAQNVENLGQAVKRAAIER